MLEEFFKEKGRIEFYSRKEFKEELFWAPKAFELPKWETSRENGQRRNGEKRLEEDGQETKADVLNFSEIELKEEHFVEVNGNVQMNYSFLDIVIYSQLSF